MSIWKNPFTSDKISNFANQSWKLGNQLFSLLSYAFLLGVLWLVAEEMLAHGDSPIYTYGVLGLLGLLALMAISMFATRICHVFERAQVQQEYPAVQLLRAWLTVLFYGLIFAALVDVGFELAAFAGEIVTKLGIGGAEN